MRPSLSIPVEMCHHQSDHCNPRSNLPKGTTRHHHRINRSSSRSQLFIRRSACGYCFRLSTPTRHTGNVVSGNPSARNPLIELRGIRSLYYTLLALPNSAQLPWPSLKCHGYHAFTHPVPPTAPNPNRPFPSEAVERNLSTFLR